MNAPAPDPRVRLITGADGDESDIVRLLDTATIRIVLPEQPGWHHQVLAITLCDLLGRLFPRIDAPADAGSAHPDLPPGPTQLADRLTAAARHGGLSPLPPGRPDVTVAVGPTGPADLYTDATGWQTFTGTAPGQLPASADQCPAGPVAAACRAAAAVFGHVLLSTLSLPPYTHGYASLLTHEAGHDPLPEPDLPPATHLDVLLVGAGSVGGAAVYTLAHAPRLEGSLAVADPQDLEPGNPARALLATATAAGARTAKADAAGAALAHHPALHVDPHRTDVTAWRAAQPRRAPLPTVLCAVDSANARRAIQDCLPLTLVNAACGPQEVTVSGHVTGDGPCVCCLHMGDIVNGDKVRKKLIADATGLPEMTVNSLVVTGYPLEAVHLRGIERFRGEPSEALARYEGRTLLDLWNEHLLYGGAPATTINGAEAVVAAPFTTALAGALLAAEALKHGHIAYEPYRRGPRNLTQYVENPYAGPAHSQLRPGRRWPDTACLCRSARRSRIATEIYGIPVSAADPPSAPAPD